MLSGLSLVVAAFAQQPAAALPPSSLLATDTLVVRGRLLDAESGQPLPRGNVTLTAHQSTGYDLAWGVGDWANPPEQTTGDDGRFQFTLRVPASFEPIDRARYHLRVKHPHHLAWFAHGTFHAGLRTGVLDHGDIRLPSGVRPRVRCVDTKGVRQAGVVLQLQNLDRMPAVLPGPTGTEAWLTRSAYGVTDIDGYLHMDHPLPNGDYELGVKGRVVKRQPESIQLPTTELIEVVVAELAPEDAIEGQVVDAAGVPVEGAMLAVGGDGGTSGVTRRDGRFTLLRDDKVRPGPAPIQMARNRRYDTWVHVATLEWGTRDAHIELPTPVVTSIVVSDPQGAACESFSLYCMPVGRNSTRGGWRIAGRFPGGSVDGALEPGDYELLVQPHGDRLAPTAWQPITIEPNGSAVAVRLAAAHERHVELVVAGAPSSTAANVLVEVIAGGEPSAFEFVRPYTAVGQRDRDPAGPCVVASARADAQGHVVVRVPELGPVHLRCSGCGVQPQVFAADLQPQQPVRIELARGCRLSGSLGPVEALPRLDPDHDPRPRPSIYDYANWTRPTLTLVFANGAGQREGVQIETDGTFACDGLPPGEVEVTLQLWQRVGNRRQRDPSPPVLGTFTVDPEQPRVVQLHLPPQLHAPAAGGTGR
jgi:hypothetical protein